MNAAFWLTKTRCRIANRTVLLAALTVSWLASSSGLAMTCRDVVLAEEIPIVIELFYRGDSDQSTNALDYVRALQRDRRGIVVRAYDVLDDQEQLKRLWQLSRRFGLQKAKVPSFYLADRLVIGFPDENAGDRVENLLTINAYVRTGCKHCEAGKQFLDDLVRRRPGLRVEYHDVVNDLNARNQVQALVSRYKVQIPSFPCIEAAGRLIVGFQSAETTGARIEALFADRSQDSASVDESTSPAAGDGAGSRLSLSAPRLPAALAAVAYSSHVIGPRVFIATARWDHPRTVPTSLLMKVETVESVSGQQEESFPTMQDDLALPDEPSTAEDVPLPDDVPLPEDAPLPPDFYLPNAAESPLLPTPPVQGDYPADEIEVPWLGRLSVSQLGLPAFTFLIGLVDGFNPCAMWVLIFLLSVLVNIKDRRKILIVAGTFVVVSGLAYFVFMAAWFNVFQLIGLLRPVQIGLGITAIVVGAINIKDFFAFHQGITLSIPESAKPGIYRRVRQVVSANHLTTALSAAIVLAVVVNIVELLCTAGLPALYTEILTMQHLPTWANYAYLALYIAAYMLDDTILVVIVVATLSNRRLQESEGRWLKLLSGIVILVLGIVMIFWPDALI